MAGYFCHAQIDRCKSNCAGLPLRLCYQWVGHGERRRLLTGEPLRVALLTYRGNPSCGGQGVYVRHMSRELARLGHHVDVISGPPYPELDDGVRLVEVPSLDLYREP